MTYTKTNLHVYVCVGGGEERECVFEWERVREYLVIVDLGYTHSFIIESSAIQAT